MQWGLLLPLGARDLGKQLKTQVPGSPGGAPLLGVGIEASRVEWPRERRGSRSCRLRAGRGCVSDERRLGHAPPLPPECPPQGGRVVDTELKEEYSLAGASFQPPRLDSIPTPSRGAFPGLGF